MQQFMTMNSIRNKTSRAFYLLAIFIVFICLFAFFNLLYLQQQVKKGVVISNFKDDILEMRRHEKNLFLYHNNSELENVLLFTHKAIDNLNKNKKSYQTFQAEINLEKLQQSLIAYQRLLQKYGLLKLSVNQLKMAEVIRPLGHQLSSIADQFAKRERDYLLQSLNATQWTLLGAILIIALTTVVVGYRLSYLVVKPLKELERNLKPIAKGQFDQLKINSNEQEIIAFTDAFNRMLFELDLRKKRLLHTEKLASLGILVSGVAHELNNPLGNILSSCQLLKEELSNGEPELLESWLQQIDSETMRAHKIVHALQDLGRQSDFIIEPVNLLDLVNSTLLLLHNELKYLPTIKIKIPDDLLINADRQKFQQVLINLIKNARDSGDENNQIELNAGHCWNTNKAAAILEKKYKDKGYFIGEVKTPPKHDNVYTSLSIKDSGSGINKNAIEHIFDPFYTTKPPGKGMGLGLYLVQEIIREHFGEIGVISQVGEGTQFLIRLPCTKKLTSNGNKEQYE